MPKCSMPSSPLTEAPSPDSPFSSPLTRLSASSSFSLATLGDVRGPCTLPDMSDEGVLADARELLREIHQRPTVEFSHQGHLFRLLWRPLGRLRYGLQDEMGLQLTMGYDLKDIHVDQGCKFRDTDIHSRIRTWTAQGREVAESAISTALGVSLPDIVTDASFLLNHVLYSVVSMVMEIKPTRDDPVMAQTAICQAILYLLTAFECCGCWLGVAFHAGRFVRMLAANARTIYVETPWDDEVELGTEGSSIPIEDFIDKTGIFGCYPWDLGSYAAPAEQHFRVLWQTIMRSVEILRDLRTDEPLSRLRRPHFPFEEAAEYNLSDRLHRIDLSKDDDVLLVASQVRTDVLKAKVKGDRRKAKEPRLDRRDDGGAGGASGGQGGPREGDSSEGRRGAGGRGGQAARSGNRRGLRSDPTFEREASFEATEDDDEEKEDDDEETEDDDEDKEGNAPSVLGLIGSPPSDRTSAPSRRSGRTDQSSSSDESRRRELVTPPEGDLFGSRPLTSLPRLRPDVLPELDESMADEDNDQDVGMRQGDKEPSREEALNEEMSEDQGMEHGLAEEDEEQDLESIGEVLPEDAVDEEYDLPTLLRLLRDVRIKPVSTSTMDRLIHGDA